MLKCTESQMHFKGSNSYCDFRRSMSRLCLWPPLHQNTAPVTPTPLSPPGTVHWTCKYIIPCSLVQQWAFTKLYIKLINGIYWKLVRFLWVGIFLFSFIKLMNFSRGFIQNFNLTVVRKNVILNSLCWWLSIIFMAPKFTIWCICSIISCFLSSSTAWEDILRDNLLNFASSAKGLLLLQQTGAMNECMSYMYARYEKKLQVL